VLVFLLNNVLQLVTIAHNSVENFMCAGQEIPMLQNTCSLKLVIGPSRMQAEFSSRYQTVFIQYLF
jgi:hypothetical protein